MNATPVPLAQDRLAELATRGITVPEYRRDAAGPRIVHVGVGGFHRAHEAVYVDELAAGGSAWRIVGVGPRPEDQPLVRSLNAQDQLYTVIARDARGTDVRVVGSVVDHRLADDPVAPLAARIADPATAIVSLTITEAGYSRTAAEDAAGVFAALARGLGERAAARLQPVTLLSCDNIRHNGDVTREALLRAASTVAPDALPYIERECTFPDSMVDRITPATTDDDRRWLRDELGIHDRWPVVCESFRQWVIEDDFAADRPAWEMVGVLVGHDVSAWETYKLRLLNATHSVLAYIAALADVRWVHEALAEPSIRLLVERFLTAEALPTIRPIAGHPPDSYARTVLERFESSAIADQVDRLCVDGTVKLATFVMPTVGRQVELGGPLSAGATALAAWARYLAVVPPDLQAPDANAGEARRLARQAVGDPVRFLGLETVVPRAVASDERFQAAFRAAARTLEESGALAAATAGATGTG